MAKFRAPSSSVASAATQTLHAQSTKRQKLRPAPRRARARKLDKTKAAVKDAAKRVQKTKQLIEPSTLFVGNIGPDVDESMLTAHFSGCGNILSARIHCCGGVAMTVKPPPPSYHKNMRVRQYGIMVFDSKSAMRKALRLRGSVLGGRVLTVSLSICDLPEVKEKIVKRIDDYRAKFGTPDVQRAQKSALKSLKLEPTVLLDANERMVHKRFKILGHTFRVGIM